MVKIDIQEQLAEDLLQAQTALKEFGEGENDDDVTIDDFEEIIVDELNKESILVSDERIIAVAEWVVTCIEDNGIHISTAIEESIESSIDELMNDYQNWRELLCTPSSTHDIINVQDSVQEVMIWTMQ